MKQLTPKQQDAILYCVVLGFTQDEAARILNVTQVALALRLGAATKSLQKILSR